MKSCDGPALLGLGILVLGLAGCGHTVTRTPPLLSLHEARRQSRPIGAGARYQPAAPDRPVPRCRPGLGPRLAAHVELFAHDRVVIVPAGIGTRGPRALRNGRIARARCYGSIVTLDPSGVVLVRPGRPLTVEALFRQWGKPLAAARMAGFGGAVRAYVDGRRRQASPSAIPLERHAEIVLEVGPFVPPHPAYGFPPGY